MSVFLYAQHGRHFFRDSDGADLGFWLNSGGIYGLTDRYNHYLAASPDGAFLYAFQRETLVSNALFLSKIDATNNTIVAQYALPNYVPNTPPTPPSNVPRSLAVSNAGGIIYLTEDDGTDLYLKALDTNLDAAWSVVIGSVNDESWAIAVSLDDSRIFVSVGDAIQVYDNTTHVQIASSSVYSGPITQLARNHHDDSIYGITDSGELFNIPALSNTVDKVVYTGDDPQQMTIAPDDANIYVVGKTQATRYNPSDLTAFSPLVNFSGQGQGIAANGDGSMVYIATNADGGLLYRYNRELTTQISSTGVDWIYQAKLYRLDTNFPDASTLAITGITPASGLTTGGQSCVITGANFVSGDTILFGGAAATSVGFVNSTTLTATAPAHTVGLVDVRVYRSVGVYDDLVNGFEYVPPPPSLMSITPLKGFPGTNATIAGTNLSSASVTFPTGGAATIVSNTATQIIVTIPPGATSGDVTVTTAGGGDTIAWLLDTSTSHVNNIVRGGFAPSDENPVYVVWKMLRSEQTIPVPEAPGAVGFDDYGGSFHTVVLPPLPLYASGLKLYRKAPGESAFSVLASGLASNARLPISGLEFDSRYDYYATAYNTSGESTPGPAAFIITDPSDSGAVVPSTPGAPTVVKNCAGSKIVVTDSDWNEEDDITGAGLRRRVNGGAIEILSPGWSTAGSSYNDEAVSAFDSVEYSVNRISAGAISAWSAWSAPVALQSETLELAWLEPDDDAVLSGKVTLRFSLDDTGETENDCGDPVVAGACNSETPEISLWLDGIELDDAPALAEGTPRHGEYSLLLDTRDFANGARVLKVLARGTDCCFQKAERTVTLQNTLRLGVLYAQVNYEFAPPAGMEYSQAELSLQNEALNINPSRRYWTRHSVATATPAVDFLDTEVLPDDKADAFDELQQVTLRRAQPGTTPERTQYFDTPLLAPAGASVHWVQQWIPEQSLTFHTTGCERIEKFREIESGKTLVFARSEDGSAAKVFSYELGVLTLLADLGTHGAADATDAALLEDKVFVVAGGEIFAVDLDSGQATLNLAPRGETRAPRFVEKVGDTIIAIFVDENLEAERTRAYDLTFAAPRLLWLLDDAATRVFPSENSLIVACGAEYFSTAAIATAPTLKHTFDADVVAMDATADEPRVKLQSGAVWRKGEANWIEEVAAGDAGSGAVAAWEGAGDVILGVAGGESPQLIEELSSGQWIDGRTIAPGAGMAETIESIAALARYEKIVTPASGTPGQPGYVPAKKEVALLIGTAPDGVLAVLELSDWSEERGALKASRVSHLNIDAYNTPILGE